MGVEIKRNDEWLTANKSIWLWNEMPENEGFGRETNISPKKGNVGSSWGWEIGTETLNFRNVTFLIE